MPDSLRGKVSTLKLKLNGGSTVYLDNVFFKSEVLQFGNPQPANIGSANNYLIEKPQYTLSYNDELKEVVQEDLTRPQQAM